jgi:peptidyl-prolyl cis-trans isomerase D
MLRQQFPRGDAQAGMLLPFFASRAADNLINREVVLAEAERLGLHATDEELRDELERGRYSQIFFPGGKFVGQDEYEARIQQANLTVPEFEGNVKQEIIFDKLRNLILTSAPLTETDLRQEFDKRNTKVKFDYAVVRKDDVLKAIHPTEAELKAFYDRNQATYKNSIPEKRKVNYVLLDNAKIEAETPVSREDLQAYYNQHRDEFRVPGQVNVRQILIKTPLPGADGKIDPKGVEEARKKAEDVSRQLKAGAKFEELAKKYSDDPSGKNGGSIGWVQHFPVPSVDKVAYSLPKGATSDVIDAGYAFVILHIDDKQDAHVKSLEEVKAQIEPIIKQPRVARAAESQANALLTQARTSGLEKAAAAKGLQVVSTDFISRTDSLPGIGNAPELMEAVFSAAEKAPPDQVQLARGYVVYEVLGIKPPTTPSFEEIHSRVETEFKNERSAALLSQKTQELADRAKAEHDLKKAAKELGATVKTSDWVLPEGQVPDVGTMSGGASVAFTMKPGEISGPIETGTNGVVLALLDKQLPSGQDFAAKKDELSDSLRQQKQAELFGMFVANLREQMEKSGKVKINQDEMKRLTRQGGEEGG